MLYFELIDNMPAENLNIGIPLHKAAVRGLKAGGVFILEAFSKEQLDYCTGWSPIPGFTHGIGRVETNGLLQQRKRRMHLSRNMAESWLTLMNP